MQPTNELNLEIKNFQIIKKAELKFEKGVNLVVGPSGNGKSSILRSLKALLLNPSGSQKFIKHGTELASVLMSYNNNSVEWKRTDKGASYTVNGQSYSKQGTSNITKFLSNSGFVIDYKNDILNLEGAWQILFPFDKSDAELFKLFENIFCVSDSGKIFQSYKVEEDRLNKELQEYVNTLNRNKTKIEAIEDLQSKVDLDKLRKYRSTLIDANNKRVDLTLDINVLRVNGNYLNALNNVSTKTTAFNSNLLRDFQSLSRDILTLKKISKYPEVKKDSLKEFNKELICEYTKIKEDIKTLEKVEKFPVVEDSKISFRLNLINDYVSVRKDLDKLKILNKELRDLKVCKESIESNFAEVTDMLKNHSIRTCEVCMGSGIVAN